MKRIFLVFAILLSFVCANEKKDVLVLSGPVASVSHPFFKIIKDGSLSDVANKVEFREWKSPDELRAIVLKGEVDVVAMPTNVAAILYNKDQKVKLLEVSIWGIMSIVSTDENIKSVEDLKGQEVLVPFRGDMPDILLQAILRKAGIEKDVKINYVSSPPDAVQMLVAKKGKNALLVEPITSMAILKTSSFPQKVIAPKFYRAIDLQAEWGRLYETKDMIPQAGIAAVGDVSEHIQERVIEEYNKALEWYRANPKKAGELVADNIKMFNGKMVEESIKHVRFDGVKTIDAREDLEKFFSVFYEINPKIIGEKIPDEGFYK